MATVRTTLGTLVNQNVDIQSVAGAGPWDVTLAAPPSADCKVGDTLSDEAATPNVYLITAIAGSVVTVRDAWGAGAAPATGASQAFTRRSYDSVTAWKADLDDDEVYDTGDAAVGAVCETLAITADQIVDTNGTLGLGAIWLIGHEDYRHTGLPGTGVALTTTNGYHVQLVRCNTPVACYLEWLEVSKLPVSGDYNEYPLIDHWHATGTVTVGHCLVYGNGYAATGGNNLVGIRCNSVGGVLHVHNCAIWNISNPTTSTGVGIDLGYAAASSTILNTTIHGSDTYNITSDTNGKLIQNVIAADAGTQDIDDAITWHANSGYNITSDATAPGENSLINQASADVLLDAANGDLHQKADSPSIGVAATLTPPPTDVNIDLDGQTRSVPWDVGAYFITPEPQPLQPIRRGEQQYPRQIGSTTHPTRFFMASSVDHATGLTGLTVATQIRKPSASWSFAAGAVSEIGGGWYEFAGAAADRESQGDLLVVHSAPDADSISYTIPIVTHDPWNIAAGAGGGDATLANQVAMLTHLLQIKGDNWDASMALDQFIELDDVWARPGKVRTTPPTDADGIEEHLAWLSHVARHKVDVDKSTGQAKIYDEAGEQVIGIAGVSDDGTLYIRERVIAPS